MQLGRSVHIQYSAELLRNAKKPKPADLGLHKKISQSFSEPPPPANISEATWTVSNFLGFDAQKLIGVQTWQFFPTIKPT